MQKYLCNLGDIEGIQEKKRNLDNGECFVDSMQIIYTNLILTSIPKYMRTLLMVVFWYLSKVSFCLRICIFYVKLEYVVKNIYIQICFSIPRSKWVTKFRYVDVISYIHTLIHMRI